MQEGYASKRIIARTCARPWVSIHTNTHTHNKRVTLEREKKKKKVCHSPLYLCLSLGKMGCSTHIVGDHSEPKNIEEAFLES